MNVPNDYHHGQTIREFRKERGMTLAELAEHWPAGSVSTRYIQGVESGEKHITDQDMLRATFRELEQVRRSQYERTRRVHRRG
jgi:transcriptional regulator with XRE-family HTH domain